jgi:phage gp36-like protein
MSFATRSDLLARSNAVRLAQLALPADYETPADPQALREAIDGGDLSAYPAEMRAAIALALDAIDKALADADAMLISYGVPPEVQTALLARLASTVALYYLQGAERMTEDMQRAYDGVIKLLDRYAKGQLPGLVPDTGDAAGNADPGPAIIVSAPSRYGRR